MPQNSDDSPSVNPAAPMPAAPKHKPGPQVLAVIDYEGSGLKLTGVRDRDFAAMPHEPGVDHDCILEVAVVVLDARGLTHGSSLRTLHCQSWLVLPPGVDTVEKFDVWAEKLKVADPWVFNTHSTKQLVRRRGEEADVEVSLLDELRALAGGENKPADPIAWAEGELLKVIGDVSTENMNLSSGARVHPGNSAVMFTGNSIANYDIPMTRRWMPKLVEALSYRIMDISVLRTFYQDIAGIELPEGLAEAIKSGGGGHRALDDVLYCTNSLKELVNFARESSMMRAARLDFTDMVLKEANERIAHLEMLIRYGRRGAIKEERKLIAARGLWNTEVNDNEKPEERQGLFRGEGGIFKKPIGDEPDDVNPNVSKNGH